MTQIKGTFEGCREAPAPLKLNEVFISHADSTLNTARSRAVTVNVSLPSIHCLFSLANGPGKKKKKTEDTVFHTIFHALLSPSPCISHTWSSPISLYYLLILFHYTLPPNCLPYISSRRKPVYCGFCLDLKATRQG